MSVLYYLLVFLITLDLSFLALTGNGYLAKLATFLLDSNMFLLACFESSFLLTCYSNHTGAVSC
ncbi:hypothetical protein Hanom_Chr16g01468731 [Helianthus anomalus]